MGYNQPLRNFAEWEKMMLQRAKVGGGAVGGDINLGYSTLIVWLAACGCEIYATNPVYKACQ